MECKEYRTPHLLHALVVDPGDAEGDHVLIIGLGA